ALFSSVSAASILDPDSAVTAPYTVPPSAPTVPPAAATPRPSATTAPHTRAPSSLAAPQTVPTFPTPSTMAIPGVAPAARPNPAPFRAPIAFPLVGASTCASGTNPATGSAMVLSSARPSRVGDSGSGGGVSEHHQGPAQSGSPTRIRW